MGNFAIKIERPKAKTVSSSGGFAPSHQGLCPWTPLGAPPKTLVIGSRSARSPCLHPLCQILNTPLIPADRLGYVAFLQHGFHVVRKALLLNTL